MNYENTDGFKIRDQSAYHLLTFTVVAGSIYSPDNAIGTSSSTVSSIVKNIKD